MGRVQGQGGEELGLGGFVDLPSEFPNDVLELDHFLVLGSEVLLHFAGRGLSAAQDVTQLFHFVFLLFYLLLQLLDPGIGTGELLLYLLLLIHQVGVLPPEPIDAILKKFLLFQTRLIPTLHLPHLRFPPLSLPASPIEAPRAAPLEPLPPAPRTLIFHDTILHLFPTALPRDDPNTGLAEIFGGGAVEFGGGESVGLGGMGGGG